MGAYNYYAGAIWTNHVLSRLKERGMTQQQTALAFSHPDSRQTGTEQGSYRFEKRFGRSRITVIAKQNEKSEWVIISAWIDPPVQGTADARKKSVYKEYQHSSGWKKVWMTILKQLGLINY